MSSGTQIDLTSPNGGYGGTDAPPASAPAETGNGGGRYLSDEEILGIDPPSPNGGFGGPARCDVIANPDDAGIISARNSSSIDDGGKKADSAGENGPRNDDETISAAGQDGVATMPAWMQAVAGDPQHGSEAQQLWREHQEFRAAFSSPQEARAIKELFPGGAQEAEALRQATQSVDRIDAAIFPGDARAQSEVVAELARANPAAFRSMFAEAARVLSGMGNPPSPKDGFGGLPPATNPGAQAADSDSLELQRHATVEATVTTQAGTFDPAAYASFERSTNDAVARDVRTSIQDTLARVLPEGVAEGAARRIGEDIFNEVHRALAADRTLSDQVASVLRDPAAAWRGAGQGWRFGAAEQQRVAALLAGRAKQIVPGVARRVIGEWTSSVLGTARSKAARQAAAASRVDIAAPGGSLDSMPLRAMSPREVNYASMSDDEILGMR